MNKKRLIFLLLFSSFFIALPFFVSAALVPCTGDKPCDLCDFFLLISNVYQFIGFRLAPPIAGLMFLIAGALFLVSGGSQERVTQAKKIFSNVVLGLVFVYTSWLIVHTLINVVGRSVENFSPQSWFNFKCTTPSSSLFLSEIKNNQLSN